MLTVVIQAGGKSSRMGEDKALLPFLGKPLIQRVILRTASLADEILITTNRPDAYAFLNLPLITDAIPERGALGGVYTALQAASKPLVAIVACDMPFVCTELIAAERDILLDSRFDLAIPDSGEGLEPFHAVYRRASCLAAVEEALQAGKWRVDAWFHRVRLRILKPEDFRRYDPLGLCFKNVNTPGELSEAEQLSKEIDQSA